MVVVMIRRSRLGFPENVVTSMQNMTIEHRDFSNVNMKVLKW
jgi:hypothetical protein